MNYTIRELAARLRDFSRGREDVHDRAASALEELDKELSHWWRLSMRRQQENQDLRYDLQRYRVMLGGKNAPEADMAELLRLHNEARQKSSWMWEILPLQEDRRLMEYAQEHALWMSNLNRLKHSSMQNIMKLGFTAAGENIAWGQDTPASVMKSWLYSPGHRRNIMSTKFNKIGCGARKDSKGRLYWCVVFAHDSQP